MRQRKWAMARHPEGPLTVALAKEGVLWYLGLIEKTKA
jgi:hypothetical protein